MDRFTRTAMLLGDDAMARLAAARVAVFGLGGVGGYVVEALARSGVGALDLIDNDTISVTNINRQILATHRTVGMNKTDAAAARVSDINPNCKVTPLNTFYSPQTADEFDLTQYDYIVDAIDTVTAKLELAVRADAAGVPLISSMGTGNKLDPTAFVVTDINKTTICPLARVMRKELRARGIKHLKVVYSPEEPRRPAPTDEVYPVGRRDIPGSVAYVPSAAGLVIASAVIDDLIRG